MIDVLQMDYIRTARAKGLPQKVVIDGLRQLDFMVVLAMQMFYVVITLIGNLIMDLGYSLVDPRVKLS